MKRFIISVILIILCFLLQTTFFQGLDFGGIVPNLMIVLTASFGFMRGEKTGLLYGFFCGLLVECHDLYVYWICQRKIQPHLFPGGDQTSAGSYSGERSRLRFFLLCDLVPFKEQISSGILFFTYYTAGNGIYDLDYAVIISADSVAEQEAGGIGTKECAKVCLRI